MISKNLRVSFDWSWTYIKYITFVRSIDEVDRGFIDTNLSSSFIAPLYVRLNSREIYSEQEFRITKRLRRNFV